MPNVRVLIAIVLMFTLAACGEVAQRGQPDAPPAPIDAGDGDDATDLDAPSQPTCGDDVENGNETDVDCGGPTCGPCADTLGCAAPDDCSSGVCTALTCTPPACDDGVRNLDELDVDCAGHCGAASCDLLQMCGGVDAVCSSNACATTRCAAVFAYTGAAQTLTVPAGVTSMTIEALGASGGPSSVRAAGRGASIQGTFAVTPGEVLTIIVGGAGTTASIGGTDTGGGGGGGTAVLRGTTALVIAGGGGGAGYQEDGKAGGIGPDGTAGFSQPSNPTSGGPGGAGGADGANNWQNNSAGGRGWNGGVPTAGVAMTHSGGWGCGGGGGGCGSDCHGGGGGGGYSGGGGGYDGGGGGGGSINTGSNQVNSAGVRAGHGAVGITP